MRVQAAATASRHWFAASVRNIRSVATGYEFVARHPRPMAGSPRTDVAAMAISSREPRPHGKAGHSAPVACNPRELNTAIENDRITPKSPYSTMERGTMRHPNVRNADELEIREMIKGRHNMRLRQLGKPAGSRALGATLTELAPGAISFPRPRPLCQRGGDLRPLWFRRGTDRRGPRRRASGRLDRVAAGPRACAPDGQLFSGRTARLSLRLDDARGRDRRVSRF